VRNSSLVECAGADNGPGLKLATDAADWGPTPAGHRPGGSAVPSGRGAFGRQEAGPEGPVERAEVRMPV